MGMLHWAHSGWGKRGPTCPGHAMTTVTAAAAGASTSLPGRRLPAAAAAAVGLCLVVAPWRTEPRHVGQESWETSHVSTQRTWKPWPQRGSTRTFSPSANSPRQMAQTSAAAAGLATSAPIRILGFGFLVSLHLKPPLHPYLTPL